MMYFHQAMKAPDRQQFLNVMDTKIQGHEQNNNWEVIPHSKVPQDTHNLDSVWALWRSDASTLVRSTNIKPV